MPKPQIRIEWKRQSREDVDAARALISRVHYQQGKIDGEFVIGFASLDEIKRVEPHFVPSWISEGVCLVGVAVLKQGIMYSKPKGRRYLAEKHFPGLQFDRLNRAEVVREMGLALISRVAVEPVLQKYGIGRSLVKQCRKKAPSLVPGSRYVEVMTSQRLHDAQKLLKKDGAKRDFLQAAGFRLAPVFTKIGKTKRDGRDRRLYYWAAVI